MTIIKLNHYGEVGLVCKSSKIATYTTLLMQEQTSLLLKYLPLVK